MNSRGEKTDDTIVVTGLGAITPLASGMEATWRRLLAGESGVKHNTRFNTAGWKCQIAGLVPSRDDSSDGFDPTSVMSPQELRKTDLFIHYAIAAADEALRQSGWHPKTPTERSRTATIIATGVGGIPAITGAVETIRTGGVRRLSPFTVPSFLPNLAAGQIAIRFGFSGPSGAPVTACAASAQAIGDAMRMIRTGEADIALCGGTEACVDPVSIGGFTASRALSVGFNSSPASASRPFDKDHDGFVLSEGAAMLVIERWDHARRRGATPLAVLSGYGTTTDAHHITAGWPDGRQAARAMNMALEMARITPKEIGYVNAHATSTPVGDKAELSALTAVFGPGGKGVPVSSTKSATGHMLGAAGAIEALFSIMALRDQILPAGLNISVPVQEADGFDLVRDNARRAHVDYVLSNAFGFGGVNASLVFSRWS
jgi:3-oxoacyl-[acyl-carrier-protein] synthase II